MPTTLRCAALRRLLMPLFLATAGSAAFAQYPPGAVVQPLPRADDPAELLAGALRTLATEPNNLDALTTAGHNALALGDPNAAVGFFGRAQGIAPRDGQVKAGLGSALVQLEKPQDALRLFGEATRLGVPDIDLAQDRGLAYDLTGNQRLAQRDYMTVLQAHPDDDTVRRRLALSYGISGDKVAALATLDPLIRKRDIAAWRAQTFVLAMDGDPQGAHDITRVMLPQQADSLQPFLLRLATLSPADKARAVHFGEMPSSGRAYTPTQIASSSAPSTYAAPTPAAPRSDLAAQPAATPTRTAPVRTTPARVARRQAASPATSAPSLAATALTPETGQSTPPAPASTPAPAPAPQVQVAQAMPQPAPATSSAPPLPTAAVTGHYDLPHDTIRPAPRRPERAAPAPMRTVGTPVVHGTPGKPVEEAKPARTEVAAKTDSEPAPAPVHARKTAEKPDRDEEATKAKPSRQDRAAAHETAAQDDDCDTAAKSGRHSSRSHHGRAKTKCAETAAAEDKPATRGKAKPEKTETAKSARKPAAKAEPERVYVQVAGGANKDDLDKAWANIRKKAPVLTRGKTPHTTPLRYTNRLLIGPFKDEDAAQAYVNKLAGKGQSAFIFKSSKGQKVDKVDTAP